MEFQTAYDEFIKLHAQNEKVSAVQRIEFGLEHAEKLFLENIWWPAFRNFKYLYPQYEIRDFKEGRRYIDFAYIHGHFRIAIEIDGMGPHWKDITQEKFSDHCQRQNHLVIDGWYVLRFAYKDVRYTPRLCQQTIQQLIGRLTGDESASLCELKIIDREIVQLALSRACPITAKEVATHVHLRKHATIQHLKQLTDAGWLEPASGAQRIRSYRIHPSHSNIQL